MEIQIRVDDASALAGYASIPSTLVVREVFDVVANERGIDGLKLVHRTIQQPYTKDYDAHPDYHPTRWGERFDLSSWCFLSATIGEQVAGRAAIAWDAQADPGSRQSHVAVLWDIRVDRHAQRRGVGTALFRAAESWAMQRGAHWLKVETQNINVPACHFYFAQGCTLGAIDRFAYPDLPDEAQLIWYKKLTSNDSGLPTP
jgi:ribosomal protein S18 acetylase RimI-like enzyme